MGKWCCFYWAKSYSNASNVRALQKEGSTGNAAVHTMGLNSDRKPKGLAITYAQDNTKAQRHRSNVFLRIMNQGLKLCSKKWIRYFTVEWAWKSLSWQITQLGSISKTNTLTSDVLLGTEDGKKGTNRSASFQGFGLKRRELLQLDWLSERGHNL